jgi:hypothetical protein
MRRRMSYWTGIQMPKYRLPSLSDKFGVIKDVESCTTKEKHCFVPRYYPLETKLNHSLPLPGSCK